MDEVASGSDSEYSMFAPETQQSLNIDKENLRLRRTELDEIVKNRRVASLSTKNKVKADLDPWKQTRIRNLGTVMKSN